MTVRSWCKVSRDLNAMPSLLAWQLYIYQQWQPIYINGAYSHTLTRAWWHLVNQTDQSNWYSGFCIACMVVQFNWIPLLRDGTSNLKSTVPLWISVHTPAHTHNPTGWLHKLFQAFRATVNEIQSTCTYTHQAKSSNSIGPHEYRMNCRTHPQFATNPK